MNLQEKQKFFLNWAEEYENSASLAYQKVVFYKNLLLVTTDSDARLMLDVEMKRWYAMYIDTMEIYKLLKNYIPKVKIKEAEKNEEENSSYNGYFIHT